MSPKTTSKLNFKNQSKRLDKTRRGKDYKDREKLVNVESREHFSDEFKYRNHVCYCIMKPWRLNAITDDEGVSFYYEGCLSEK